MRTVVFGSPGQLGRDLTPRLRGEVIPLSRADVDLTSPEKVRAKLEELKPTHVVNCAAYNFVDKAETEPEVAFATNAWALRSLAQACRDLDIVLAHFSTDYVYGLPGLPNKPLSETDAPGPVSVYGLSKLAGEYQVRSICPKHFVIRTCGLYGVWGSGGKGGNFVETMLRVAGQGKPLKVVHDQRCTPSFTVDVAAAAAQLIETQAYGLYHVTNADDCSWYEFAQEIFAVAGLQADLSPITSAQFNAPAQRPPNSVLNNEKLESVGITKPRSWKEAIRQYLKDRGQRN